MKYRFSYDAKRGVNIRTEDRPQKSVNRLATIVKGRNESRTYTTTLSRFFHYIESKITDMNHIRRLDFSDECIYIDTISFNGEDYILSEDIIALPENIGADREFMVLIGRLLDEYSQVREETLLNIKETMEEIDRTKYLKRESISLFDRYNKTGKIDKEFDRKTAIDLYKFLCEDGKTILSKEYFMNGAWVRLFRTSIKKSFRNGVLKGILWTMCEMCAVVTFVMVIISVVLLSGGNASLALLVLSVGAIFSYGLAEMGGKFRSKSQNEIMNCLIVELADTYNIDASDIEKTLSAKKKDGLMIDSIYEAMKSDLEYLNSHRESIDEELISRFKRFNMDYHEARKSELSGGEAVDRCEFLNRLTEIEIAIHSNNRQIGLKPRSLVLMSERDLVRRLVFLGYDKKDIEKDKLLSYVFDEIGRIMKTPYYGCELDLMYLFKLAQDYVGETLRGTFKPSESFITEIINIESEVTRKIHIALDMEHLNEEQEKIDILLEACLMETSGKETRTEKQM